MLRTNFVFSFVVLLAASTTAAEPPTDPQAGAIKDDVGFPAVGTKWIGRIVPQSGPTVTLSYTVIEDSVFEGKPVHLIVGGNDTYVYDMANSNMIATLRLGKEVSSTMPHDGTFSWPMYIGKTWTATYTFNNRLEGMTVGPVNLLYRDTDPRECQRACGHVEGFQDRVRSGELRIFHYLLCPGHQTDRQANATKPPS